MSCVRTTTPTLRNREHFVRIYDGLKVYQNLFKLNEFYFSIESNFNLFICFIDQAEWKCHLAFLIPVDCICWSLTAIDKFKSYVGQFKAFAITVPPTVDTSTRSTAVILWGLMHKQNDIIDIDAPEAIVWRNINLQLIFQGVARSIVHIDHLSSNLFMPWLNDAHDEPRNLSIIKRSHTNRKGQIHGVVSKKSCGKVNRWLPALPCRSKEFTGTVSISLVCKSMSELYVL